MLLVIIGILVPTILSKDVYFRQIGLFKRIGQYYDGTAVEKFGHIRHFAHYDTAWQIFRDYPIFGVGNSKFRYVCHDKKYFDAEIRFTYQRCSNHPHQVHFEILAEQGMLGYLIIIFSIFHVFIAFGARQI